MIEIVTVIAILAGPFLGIFAQEQLERRRNTQRRKLDIFKTLMATRAEPLSRAHVEALNRIDVEFTDVDEKAVRDAWTALLDAFENWPVAPAALVNPADDAARRTHETATERYRAEIARVVERSQDLRATLLRVMGDCFGYAFDEVRLKRAAYRPSAHANIEEQQLEILTATSEILRGRRGLPMFVVNWPNAPTSK